MTECMDCKKLWPDDCCSVMTLGSPDMGVTRSTVCAICALSSAIQGMGSSSPSRANDNGDRVGACVISHQFVEAQLKAPSSAKFQSCSSATISQSGKLWRVSSWVEAQNSYGAQLRTEYMATIEYRGGDNWRLEALEFED